MMVALTPIMMMAFFTSFYLVLKVLRNSTSLTLIRQVYVTTIVILFLGHPTLTRYGLNLYMCMELDEGKQWLLKDLQTQCWTSEHKMWSLAIGVPMILIWVISTPLLGYLYLRRNASNLDEEVFFSRFRMLYQGLKVEFYYWEFINIFRKVFLVITNVLLSSQPDIFKALLALFILALFLRLQTKMRPYKNELINDLEQRENMTSIVTFFGALFFVNAEVSDNVQLIIFFVILAANIWFFLLGGYLLLRTQKFKIC